MRKFSFVLFVIFLISSCFVADLKLKGEVLKLMKEDGVVGEYVATGKIKVSVKNGVVRLSGSVPFPAVKERAEELAKKAGAKEVLNEIQVQPLSGSAEENPLFLNTSGLSGGLGF